MLKRTILSVALLALVVALAAPAASAQTTLDIQNGVVVGVWDNTLVIRDTAGVSRQFDVASDFRVDVDGKSTPIQDLRPGMKITAAIKTTSTPIVVQTKELKDAQYLKTRGRDHLRPGGRRNPHATTFRRASGSGSAGLPCASMTCRRRPG